MENLIIDGILKLEKLEKEHGKMGTLVALLILVIATIAAVGMICLVVRWWLSVAEWVFPKIFGGWNLR